MRIYVFGKKRLVCSP